MGLSVGVSGQASRPLTVISFLSPSPSPTTYNTSGAGRRCSCHAAPLRAPARPSARAPRPPTTSSPRRVSFMRGRRRLRIAHGARHRIRHAWYRDLERRRSATTTVALRRPLPHRFPFLPRLDAFLCGIAVMSAALPTSGQRACLSPTLAAGSRARPRRAPQLGRRSRLDQGSLSPRRAGHARHERLARRR
jgi:hypothetical protein